MKLVLLGSSLVIAAAGSALAQPPPPPPPPPPVGGPPMYTPPVSDAVQLALPGVASTATGGTIDVRGDYSYFDDLDGTLLGFTVDAQYITPQGFGGYITLPFSYVSFDSGLGGSQDSSGVGNIEVGGMYVLHNSPTLDFFGRAGVALDTAGTEEAFTTSFTLLLPQGQNAFPAGGNSNWLRGHGGVRTRGDVNIGASAGFDLPLDNDNVNVDGIFVISGAVGFNQPGFGVSGGLTYLLLTGSNDSDDDLLNLNATVDFPVGAKTKLFGAFGINLDNLDDTTAFSIGFGARFGI